MLNPIEPDLKLIAGILGDQNYPLHKEYMAACDLSFQRPEFVLEPRTPGHERYFAKAVVPAQAYGSSFDATILIFRPGDGTGDEGTYKEEQVTFSPDLQSIKGNPARLIPRSKRGTRLEGMFPLLTITDQTIYPAIGRLDELLITSGRQVYIGGHVGLPEESFNSVISNVNLKINNPAYPALGIWLTTRAHSIGQGFGDPHAVYNRTDCLQVAGFVALREGEDNPGLMKLLSECEVMSTAPKVPLSSIISDTRVPNPRRRGTNQGELDLF